MFRYAGPSYVDRILRGAKPGAGSVSEQVQARGQSEDCKSDRPYHPRVVPRPCRRGDRMKRREFIAGISAAAWPFAVRAQQSSAMVIGYLTSGSFGDAETALKLVGIRKGVSESGYVEGTNLTIEYRWANSDFGRLPELANDLVRRRVTVIVAAEIRLRPPLVVPLKSSTPLPMVKLMWRLQALRKRDRRRSDQSDHVIRQPPCPNQHACSTLYNSDDCLQPHLYRCRWIDELFAKWVRNLSASRRLCWSHPQR
jgi:hypothetical protein